MYLSKKITYLKKKHGGLTHGFFLSVAREGGAIPAYKIRAAKPFFYQMFTGVFSPI